MHRRVVSPLAALAFAGVACGDAFTAATNDGEAPSRDAATFDTGTPRPDGAVDDAAAGDDATSQDATSRDATREEGGRGKADGSIGDLDGGPALPDAGVCTRACPAGFVCFASQCEDRAAMHFSATSDQPGNWAYGYAVSYGGTFLPYSSEWTPGPSIDVWTHTAGPTFEPSVFHNSGLTPQTYAEMTIPGEALGLYPAATGEESVVRWTAPTPGLYAIDATFTGISTPRTRVTTGFFVNHAVGTGITSQALNEYGDPNTYTFTAPAQTLAAGAVVDFYTATITNLDDPPGGVTLDARITAQ